MELIVKFTSDIWQCAVFDHGELIRYIEINPILDIGDNVCGLITEKSHIENSFFFEYEKGKTGLLIKGKGYKVGDTIWATLVRKDDGAFKSAKFIPLKETKEPVSRYTIKHCNPFSGLLKKYNISTITCNPYKDCGKYFPFKPVLKSEPFDTVLSETIAELKNQIITMPDGSRIIIEKTAAFTTIDIDSGASMSSVDTINLNAAHEIIHQIILREIYGVIVIDFIGNAFKKNLASVIEYFKTCHDTVKFISMTRLNLIELIRERKHERE